ncbi:hypothetical protein IFR05_000791 [Cadophora sp. M221]|nr:hypothetical protein IFR05_000791 [Cadophora sp. M221]
MDETLNPNNGYYQRFTQLAKEFSMRSAGRWNKSKEMDYVNVLIGKWMPENSQRVAMDSQPRLSGILDTVTSTLAHGSGTRLPSEFYDKRGMAIMNRLVIEEWFSGYSESQEYRALGIGSLLGDVVSRMIVSVNSGREKKSSLGKKVNGTTSSNNPSMATVMLALSGCHVITLASILTSLGAFKFETWPPFTSHITIELFEKFEDSDLTALKMDETSFPARPVQNVSINDRPRQSTQGGHFMDEKRNIESITTIGRKKFNSLHSSERSQLDGYYVRLLFNGQPLTIPGCKASGRHLDGDESFCTLEAFKVIVDKFTPLNWKKDCWSNLDNPAIPTKPEPAGY